ncbi:glycosyltransferase family 39 protein [Neisseriaceae bacterium ESL0693]|nr:glycosyltransferase family 39 protein [Neisseriaceae bacterium ESL0693]
MLPTQHSSSSPIRLPLWLMLYFVLWVLLPFLLSGSYPLDVPEGIYWGREWQWGYYKHPPLSSWVLYSFYTVFGHIGPYLLSQCTIALSLWLAYALGKHLMSRQRAFVGALFLLAIFYYTWPSLEFNHNVAQMPVWLGLVYTFYLATRKNHWSYWILFGILAGAGMLIKYSVAVLLVVMVAYSLITPYRKLWLTPKPWLALLLAICIFIPNVVWLWHHDWLPFTYAQERSLQDQSKHGRWAALGFLGTQIINHLPLLLILLCTRTRLWRPVADTSIEKENWFFLWFLGLMPVSLLVMAGLLFNIGLRDMWGMPMWGLSGLIVAMMIPETVFQYKFKSLIKGVSIWALIITVLMAVYIGFGARMKHKPSRMDWPQTELARKTDQQWQQLSHCRLDSITGSDWIVLLAASYSQWAPSVMVSGNAAYSPWMNHERLHQYGTLAIWPQGEQPATPWLDQLAQDKQLVLRQGTWFIPWNKMPGREPLQVQWQAYIPVSCVNK